MRSRLVAWFSADGPREGVRPTSLMNSLVSNSNRSTVIWQATNLTSSSRQTSRSSCSEATPLDFIFFFIIIVAIASMPGSICTITGMGMGIGMAGFASGLICTPSRLLRSSCRP